jgi:hypothetical protein
LRFQHITYRLNSRARLETNRLDLPVLQRVFETYWPQFDAAFAEILRDNPPETVVAPRPDKDILAEILDATRSMSHRIRSLEDRSDGKIVRGSATATVIRAARGLPDPENERFDEGIALAVRLLDQGVPTSSVERILHIEHKFSMLFAKMMVENAVLVASGRSTSEKSM